MICRRAKHLRAILGKCEVVSADCAAVMGAAFSYRCAMCGRDWSYWGRGLEVHIADSLVALRKLSGDSWVSEWGRQTEGADYGPG